MTVGIAAVANRPPGWQYPRGSGKELILLVADRQIGHLDLMKAEATVPKRRGLLQKTAGGGRCGWELLFAGDVSVVDDILAHFRSTATGLEQTTPAVEDVAGEVERAVLSAREHAYEAEVLRRYGVTRDLYLARPSALPPLHSDLLRELDEQTRKFDDEWGCELLVCGFDEADRPALFSVDPHGSIERHVMSGYAAIGTGGQLALARLIRMNAQPTDPFDDMLAKVVDAKSHADLNPEVGPDFDAWVMVRRSEQPIEVDPDLIRGAITEATNRARVGWLAWGTKAKEWAAKQLGERLERNCST